MNPRWSYSNHMEHEFAASKEMGLPDCYVDPQSIGAWRHQRMRKEVLPLLEAYPHGKWMTIGDGDFGSDAHFLRVHGADVLATSLTDSTLVIAQQKGFIGEFKSINAEEIHLPDASYDFVLCKESYHHFPRPPIALYEMLRVARKAVVLLEPQEASRRLLNRVKDMIKTRLRGQKSAVFEPCGNFIFRVNVREMEKMMTALGYPAIAVEEFNDFYYARLSRAKYSRTGFATLFTKVVIAAQDILGFLRILDYGGACIILFKEAPESRLVEQLHRHGFRIHCLPNNPYLERRVSSGLSGPCDGVV
jgi:SAM-dependent methyltransferase